jgi:hypothetical protein
MSLSNSPTEEVVAVVNKLGLKAAAQHYGIDPSNLWRWLRKQGYRSKRQYVKENKNTHQYQTA